MNGTAPVHRAARLSAASAIRTAILGLLAAGGCAGDGCSCTAPIPGGFPPEERTPNMVQVRVSATGLQALEDNAATLITNLVGPDGLSFEVPASCGSNPALCCDCNGNPVSPCGPIDLDITPQAGDPPRLEVNPVNGQSRLALTARARVRSRSAIPICVDAGLFDVSCNASIDTTDSGPASVRLEMGVDLVQNAQSATTDLVVSSVNLEDLNSGDIDLSGGILCSIGELGLGLFIGSLTSPIEDIVADTVSQQVCKRCPTGTVDECGVFADRCEAGVCMQGNQCIQELGISGRLLSSSLLGSLSPGTLGGMDLYQVAGGFATTDGGGLSLGLQGGFLPAGDERARCGPGASPPPDVSIPESSFFQGNTRPDTGDPFDVAIGVHQHDLDMASWAAYQGGLLCLNVGTSTIDLLSTDTLALLMPSVLDLMHGETGQIVLGLRPQAPPDLALGTGAGPGDPLLTVSMPGLEIDFFTMVDDQFVRIMTVQTDLSMPLDLDVDGTGALVPVLGDLGDAFGNVRVLNSDALLEDPEEIAGLLPAVLAAAGPALSGALAPIALPELGGLEIRVDDITSVDGNSFLAIFGGIEPAPAAGVVAARVDTRAEIASVRLPDTDAFRAPHRNPDRAPVVTLSLGGDVPPALAATGDLEWQLRIDGGMWTPYSRDPRPALAAKVLWLQGVHTVEVRARVAGRPETTDLSPVVLRPIVDTIAPDPVLARPTPDAVWVMGSDNVTRGPLEVSYRAAGGDWHTAVTPARIDVAALAAARLSATRTGGVGVAGVAGTLADVDLDLEVVVRDQAGNAGHTAALIEDIEAAFHGSGEGGCECSAADPASLPVPLALLVIGWLLVWRRRERVVHGRRAASRAARAARATLSRVSRLGPAVLVIVAGGVVSALLPACDCGGKSAGTPQFPDPIGRFSAIAADGDRVVVSAYDDTVGDLVLIERDGDELRATFVDGLPPGVEPVDPAAFRGGVTEPGPDVGAHTSVVLRDGRALIAYQDVDNAQLKLAAEVPGEVEGTVAFETHVVDPGDGVQVGLHSALALDPSGAPAIAYLALGADDGSGGLRAQLRLAEATRPDPSGPGDWTITVVDEAAIACAGLCGAPTACAVQQGAQRCLATTDDCGACGDGRVCVSGACLAAVPEPGAYDIPQGVGLFANLAYLPDGRPVVVYYDRVAGNLVLQVRDGDAWTRDVLDSTSSSDVGQWADIAVDPDGVVHVAYQDAITDRLLYTTWDGAPGAVEVVDDGSRDGDRPHVVGASAAIFVDASGGVGVLYQDGATVDVQLARRGADGWTTEGYLVGAPLYGFYIDVARSGDSIVTSSFLYDRSIVPSGELDISTLR